MIPMIEVARISRLAIITAGAGLTVQLLAAPAMQIPSTLVVQPALIVSTAIANAPNVDAPVQSNLTPASIASSSAILLPQVRPGAVAVQPVIIPATSAMLVPSLSTGAVAVAPPVISAASIVRSPAVAAPAPAANGISPLPISATSAVGTPALVMGAVSIAPPAIVSIADVRAPIVSAGAAYVSPALIAATSAVLAPTIASAAPAQSVIAPPVMAPTSTMLAPAVTIRAPQLTNLRSIGGNLNGLGYATTDTDNGILYFYVSRSPVAPSVANIKSGSGAARSESRNVTSAAEYSFIFSLADANPYYPFFLHTTSGGLDSAIAAGPVIAKQQTITPATISSTVVPAPTVTGGAVSGYDPASEAYFAAMTVQPSTARKGLLDTLIKGLASDGVMASLDWLLLIAAHDAQAGLVNAANPSKVAAAVNSPAFTVDRGYTGDGASAYISIGEGYGVAGKYKRDDATVGAWTASALAANQVIMGTAGSNSLSIQATSTNMTWRVNTGTNSLVSFSAAKPNRGGHYAAVRSGTNLTYAYYDGINQLTGVTNSSTTVSTTLGSVLLSNATYSVDRVLASYSGAALTAALVAALHNRLSTYFTAIGAI